MGVNRDEGGQKADEIEGTRFVLSSFGFIRSFSKPRLIVVALAPAEECRTGSNLLGFCISFFVGEIIRL